ncbi:MAG TPA: TlpA disulfide reductase family protein [Acidisarcina sp.]|nr:TlpA disulfide reductase family protein [Acidisarcina sp.]
MRSRKFSTILFALALLIPLAGCDRGSHPSQIGKKAPDFTVTDATKTVRLSSYRGKVVVLNFWATWCPPCLAELPTLITLQQRLPEVVVLAVSTDQDESAYNQFLAEHKMDMVTVRDGKQETNRLYGTVRFPETYVIDRRGILRRKFVGAQNWTSPEIVSYLKGL